MVVIVFPAKETAAGEAVGDGLAVGDEVGDGVGLGAGVAFGAGAEVGVGAGLGAAGWAQPTASETNERTRQRHMIRPLRLFPRACFCNLTSVVPLFTFSGQESAHDIPRYLALSSVSAVFGRRLILCTI